MFRNYYKMVTRQIMWSSTGLSQNLADYSIKNLMLKSNFKIKWKVFLLEVILGWRNYCHAKFHFANVTIKLTTILKSWIFTHSALRVDLAKLKYRLNYNPINYDVQIGMYNTESDNPIRYKDARANQWRCDKCAGTYSTFWKLKLHKSQFHAY